MFLIPKSFYSGAYLCGSGHQPFTECHIFGHTPPKGRVSTAGGSGRVASQSKKVKVRGCRL